MEMLETSDHFIDVFPIFGLIQIFAEQFFSFRLHHFQFLNTLPKVSRSAKIILLK